MLAVKKSIALDQPYPGLRSFEANESVLFYGRSRHTEDLLQRLAQNRFLAVVGGSGSGKSSLVRAGLLPALYRGYLCGATSKWRVAVMRPGSSPMNELARALEQPGALGPVNRETLRESSMGLLNVLKAADLADGESLLLVVDQFEELFRFRRENSDRDGGSESSLFVSQLLEACDAFAAPIYVTLTMRSDFLGDCAQFPGLPEALNKGQYLIPRMNREQRGEAITEALDFFDVTMADRLVQRLLNDAGEDPDQLPVLQHALQQTYRVWEKDGRQGPIDLTHYERAGTMDRALHEHADSVYKSTSIDESERWIVERIFRCLTVIENGRAVRRPAKLERILRVIGVAGDPLFEPRAIAIIKLFANRENCFLVCGNPDDLNGDSVVDISHESLIRKWSTLRDWSTEEARTVDVYRYLRRDASLYPAEAGLWGDPDLSSALKCRKATGWNADWAEQYSQGPGVTFGKVEEFIELSIQERESKLRRERVFRFLKRMTVVMLIVVLWLGVKFFQSQKEQQQLAAGYKQLQALNEKLSADANNDREREQELKNRIAALAAKGAADDAARAELERLTKERDVVRANLQEKQVLIQQNRNQATKVSQDYSESLNTINDLQKKLDQAWKERDKARSELEQIRQVNAYPDQKEQKQRGAMAK